MDRNPNQTYVTIYKDGQARKSLWIETGKLIGTDACSTGQARKSLWIETLISFGLYFGLLGQARKSLWIETAMNAGKRSGARVRLVRACGSKPATQKEARPVCGSGS